MTTGEDRDPFVKRPEQSGEPAGAGPAGQPGQAPPVYGSPQSPQHAAPQYGAPQYGAPQYGAPQYGAPQYGAPQHGAQPASPYAGPQFGGFGAPAYGATPRNGMGIAALVLGALALVFSWTIVGGFLFGVLGVVFGFIHNGRVRRRQATAQGLGIAGLVLGIIGIVVAGILVIVGAWLFSTSRGQNYLDCVNNANGNQQEIQRCIDRYLNNP